MSYVYVRHATDGVAVPLDGLAGSLLAVFDNVLLPLGWSKPFVGTNKAVYRPPAGHRRFLRVDDSFGAYARLRMYDSMSDVDTGTNPVPLDTQVLDGLYFAKSSAASGLARDWAMFVADSYFYLRSNATGAPLSAAGMFFGDFDSLVPGDLYNSALIAGSGTTNTGTRLGERQYLNASGVAHYAAGSLAGAIGSTPIGKSHNNNTPSSHIGADGIRAFPNAADGKVYTSTINIHEATSLRGALPGLIAMLHSSTSHGYDDYTIFDGSGDLAGRRFMVLQYYNGAVLCHEIPPGYLM